MSKHIVAALQIGSDLIEGKAKTLEKNHVLRTGNH